MRSTMGRDLERTVQESILDRLVDDEPGLAGDPTLTWAESVRQLKLAVRRDLEWLLNTRRIPMAVPEACEELRESLFRYGLADQTMASGGKHETAVRLAREVEEAITLFEPRLAGTHVVRAETDKDGARRVHFVVAALLRLDPTPERIVFDTVLDVAKGEFEVESAAGTR